MRSAKVPVNAVRHAPGFYAVGEVMYVDAEEVLADLGLPVTESEQLRIAKMIQEIAEEDGKGFELRKLSDHLHGLHDET